MTTELKIKITEDFIRENKIEDEDTKQELYLAALQNGVCNDCGDVFKAVACLRTTLVHSYTDLMIKRAEQYEHEQHASIKELFGHQYVHPTTVEIYAYDVPDIMERQVVGYDSFFLNLYHELYK